MSKLSKILLLLVILLPILLPVSSRAENTGAIYENIYLRVAPSNVDGVIDLYYKDKNGNWKKFNSITPLLKVGDSFESAQESKISFTAEQLTDGLSSRPDLTRVKIQFEQFQNGGHIYLLMDLEQGKPYAKFSAFKNVGSTDIKEISLAMTNGLEELVQNIKVNATTYQADKCNTYSPGCNDIRTITDKQEFTLVKPDNRIITLTGETGVKQLMFFDQDFQSNDKLVTQVNVKGASATNSIASPSAKRKEDPWFGTTYLVRSPFNGDTNSWYFGYDAESIKTTAKPVSKPKKNLSFRVKFAGIDKNVGGQRATITVKAVNTKVLEKKINLVGTSSGVYVGTLEDIPGDKALQIYIKGPKHLTSRFSLPVGVETVDWTLIPLKGGDTNGDDRVDSTDFGFLQRDYLQSITSVADFNFDTRVDSQDFAILQTGYQVRAPKP
jgi:hypothetical protein